MIVEKHVFQSKDLVAGSIALDFINTVTGRDVTPRDWLDGYPRLIEWARFRAEFNSKDLDALSLAAGRNPAGARTAFAHATRLREALCRCVHATLEQRTAGLEARLEIERAHQAAMKSVHFDWSANGCQLAWTAKASGLDLITHVIVVNAVSLLAHIDSKRLRVCAGVNCGWLFLDSSRNGRRRWCDMTTCGNVAKARRHYRRRVQL